MLLRHVHKVCTLGTVHYSIIVDSIFLSLFVGVTGTVDDRRHLWCTDEDTVWRALRFLNIPRQVFHNLLEAAGMLAPCPYVTRCVGSRRFAPNDGRRGVVAVHTD